jgi:hypothetical protein
MTSVILLLANGHGSHLFIFSIRDNYPFVLLFKCRVIEANKNGMTSVMQHLHQTNIPTKGKC